jgi:MoxR-like ATPase
MKTISQLQQSLSASLIERDGEVRACLLGLVAREHVLMVGPPGTAKSLLATSLASAINGARAFSVLLTKYTSPEEVYGPVSLSALKQDRYERKLDGYAGTAEIVFVDEVWKASSAILNTLLTLLQERTVDNGGSRVPAPLRLAIAASNEWPDSESGQELGAIFDRFLIRRTVRPVSPQGRDRLLYEDLPALQPCVSLADTDAAAVTAAGLPISAEARVALGTILDELAGAGIRPGDRRCRKSVAVARAATYLDGAAEVQPHHLEDLSMVLWVDPSQADKAGEIISRIANPAGARVNELLRSVDELVQATGSDPAARMGAIRKLEESEAELRKLVASGANGRATAALQYTRRERVRMQAAALGIDPAKAEALLGGGQ